MVIFEGRWAGPVLLAAGALSARNVPRLVSEQAIEAPERRRFLKTAEVAPSAAGRATTSTLKSAPINETTGRLNCRYSEPSRLVRTYQERFIRDGAAYSEDRAKIL